MKKRILAAVCAALIGLSVPAALSGTSHDARGGFGDWPMSRVR